MSLSIGRFGLTVSANAPLSWAQNGDKATMAGQFVAGTPANALVLRQQIEGYVDNPYERYIPIVWTEDPDRTGYYTMDTVDTTTDANLLASGLLSCRASFTRVRGFSYPMAESIIRGAPRAGKPAAMFDEPYWCVPSTWSGVDLGFGVTAASSNTARKLNNGSATPLNMQVFSSSTFYNFTPQIGVAPADWYTGAVTLEVGSPLAVRVGAQITSTPTSWRISNGLVRIGNSTAAGNNFTMQWSNAAGTTWQTVWGVQLGTGPGGVWGQIADQYPRSITVIRNAPEEVIVRLVYPLSGLVCEISLRRGARNATIMLSSNTQARWGVGWQSTAAQSNIDPFAAGWNCGMAETVNNADGDTRELSHANGASATRDLANGRAYWATNTPGPIEFGLGNAVGGTGASAPDQAYNMLVEYFGAISEVCTIVKQ